jgi:23S rRNA maturation-related 3'-5' exoribonuclease YhaM
MTPNPKSPLNEFTDLLGERAAEIQRFETFLETETSWLTSPASTRFHLPLAGGLVEHSLNVARTLLRLRDTLAPDLSAESCVIVGLYHDVGKVGMPWKPYYLPNPSEWHVRNRGANYIVNQDLVHMDIATRSLFLVAQHIQLTDEEAQAIRYHDGQYIDENGSVAHRECRLTRLVQYADNWSGGVLEERPGA